ncbi:MAG: tripartite tricarboxylate transporter substrate binding protein [Proteobacteria bacterium]|nr:tripartite tricarboxylate transporter substrate binding protein [Pseudomonadota bacterium]
MPITRLFFRAAAAIGFAMMTVSSGMAAQSFPTRPLKVVVSYSPGGAADILARAVADRLGRRLEQSVIVENMPGAGGAIAARYVAKSAPDGYTMLLSGTTALVLYPLLHGKPVYDAQNDFTGIGMVASSPLVLDVASNSNIHRVAEFVKAARGSSMAYGSAGIGSALNIAGELFKSVAGVDLLHVPYKGSAPALNALMAGEVNAVFDVVASSEPLIESGRLRALAVLSKTRSKELPDVPTLREQGYKNFDFSVRYSLVVPKSTPSSIVTQLNGALNAALLDPTLAQQLKTLALDVTPSTPEAVMEFAKQGITRLKPIIKAEGIKLD